MKRVLSILFVAALLLNLSACGKKIPQIEDTFANGVCQGNDLVTEQGDYLLMRGEGGGNANLLLYRKNDGKAYVLAQAAAYKMGLLNQKAYYRVLGEKSLYCVDLTNGETAVVQQDVKEYQVRTGYLYFTKNQGDGVLYKTDLATGMTTSVKTSLSVDSFWFTDYGLYYFNEESGLLQVQTSVREMVVYKGNDERISSLISIGGADIAFLSQNPRGNKSTLKVYTAANRIVTDLLSGALSPVNLSEGKLTVADQTNVYSVDPVTFEKTVLFPVPPCDYVQVMSDCVVFYNKNQASIRYIKRPQAEA